MDVPSSVKTDSFLSNLSIMPVVIFWISGFVPMPLSEHQSVEPVLMITPEDRVGLKTIHVATPSFSHRVAGENHRIFSFMDKAIKILSRLEGLILVVAGDYQKFGFPYGNVVVQVCVFNVTNIGEMLELHPFKKGLGVSRQRHWSEKRDFSDGSGLG